MSLIDGWFPITLQLLALAALVVAVGTRSRNWVVRWVPVALAVGLLLAAFLRWLTKYQGWSEKAVSSGTVFWNFATGVALVVLILGWPGSSWRRRAAAVLAVPLCVLSSLAALNTATGYFPTMQSAWQRVTGSQPPQWIDQTTLAAMQRDDVRPTRGTLVSVDIPADASGFAHRSELVYLPPAWFSSNPPPQLPAVMVIGAEFSHPNDWLESGGALKTLDEFAGWHRGNTPIMVFPDSTGKFDNDTECVNGPRGNAADHLIKDVVPYVISNFGASPDPAKWGLVGWSSGGTCALMLGAKYPEHFSAFVDLDGQLGANTGTKAQTIARLFGGDAEAWAAFDPRTIIEKHGRYSDMSAWIGVSETIPTEHRAAGDTPATPEEIGEWDTYSEDHAPNARKLCLLLSGHGVECSVVGYGGSHDFQSAGKAFADALPWLAGELGTPEVDPQPMPGAPGA